MLLALLFVLLAAGILNDLPGLTSCVIGLVSLILLGCELRVLYHWTMCTRHPYLVSLDFYAIPIFHILIFTFTCSCRYGNRPSVEESYAWLGSYLSAISNMFLLYCLLYFVKCAILFLWSQYSRLPLISQCYTLCCVTVMTNTRL